ncbi:MULTISPECIES: hypothetical protein [unclassified Microcoleus]|uniref:hypothetical protein n=1 Tax=unclassified Microcoleus TaxID=2642155 RepID=UPI001DC76F46|nr:MULTISPECIES: hypothetical protein [unclassified Microcoleus]MCC3569525.1 hypothetical protein [Microcoleus sp. PH2017_31_RDM_U_A]MCC3581865.1 hypothetical protein [Microcoleus sp. PH2017_32_RDM_D_A]MCC3619795.1 hypothetical protein [Microcoleus sp. PH2017_38_RDM_U_B]
MARRYTWQQLEKRAAISKARETYLDAQKKSPTVSKPYKPEGDKTELAAYSFEDPGVIVTIPVLAATATKISSIMADAGVLTAADAAALPLTVSSQSFKEAHKQVLRVTIHEAKATPTVKNTPWGTRVVDMIDNSYSFPFSLGADSSPTVKEAKTVFKALFSTGGGKGLLNKKGSYATLSFRGKVLATVKP